MNRATFDNIEKADVHNHLHLSGSILRLRQIYPEADINIPTSYNGLEGMIDFIYSTLNSIMLTDVDVVNFMEIAIKASISDKVTLLEASVDIGLARFFNQSIDELIEVVVWLQEKYSSQIDFRPDIGVNKDLDIETIYSDGVKCMESGVFSGIDFYGKENNQDLQPLIKFYDIAREHHLKTKVHIGEFTDHLSIEKAIRILKPSEIQHGIRAVDSIKTMDLILKEDIQLNICPQSNVSLGASIDLINHPIRTLFDHGIKVTVNTDDLLLFGATVSDQLNQLVDCGLFTIDEVERIRKNGFS